MSERLQIEEEAVSKFNSQYGTDARKVKGLPVGNANAKHEFDLYEPGKVIGGVTTSPWTNKTGSTNTGGQDRAAAELLWLSLWGGEERRILIVTDPDMARRLLERFGGCPFPKPIEILQYNSHKKQLVEVGRL